MRVRWHHPGPDLFEVAREGRSARLQRERSALRKEEQVRENVRRRAVPECFNRRRLSQIVSLLTHRYNGPADTEDAAIWLWAAFPHLLMMTGGPGSPEYRNRAFAWAAAWTPALSQAEIASVMDDVEREMLQRPGSLLRKDVLGKLLRLTNAERKALKLWTISPIDRTTKQLAADRANADRDYQKSKREQAGATPRELSKSRLKPWEKAGVSRASWYRNQARETNSSATSTASHTQAETVSSATVRSTTINTTKLSHRRSDSPLAGPARLDGPARPGCAGGPSPSAQTIQGKANRSRETGLPGKGRDDPRDFIGDLQPPSHEIGGYAREGGIMPVAVVRATLETKRLRHFTQEQVARAIGISRPQLANAMQGRFGLSQPIAANLVAWLS